jgi:hypothetical protein
LINLIAGRAAAAAAFLILLLPFFPQRFLALFFIFFHLYYYGFLPLRRHSMATISTIAPSLQLVLHDLLVLHPYFISAPAGRWKQAILHL